MDGVAHDSQLGLLHEAQGPGAELCRQRARRRHPRDRRLLPRPEGRGGA